MIKENLVEFSTYYPQILILCGSLCYSVALKLLFNTCAKAGKDFRVPIDRWALLDLISAVFTLFTFPYILAYAPEDIATPHLKKQLDLVVLVMVVLQWGRFYLFFLMIAQLSKMLLTFIAMVIDTIPFIFLVMSYLIISSAIFTTLFQDVNPTMYKDFETTMRTLFDGLMGVFLYKGFGEKEWFHTIFIALHVLLSSILLLNYLVAILS